MATLDTCSHSIHVNLFFPRHHHRFITLPMDKIKEVRYPSSNKNNIHILCQKLAALRAEADTAVERAEGAESKNKKYEQDLLQKDQEITSLQHRIGVLEQELEKIEGKLSETKVAAEEGEKSKSANDGLVREIQLLEEELDAAEKNVKETVEKWVSST